MKTISVAVSLALTIAGCSGGSAAPTSKAASATPAASPSPIVDRDGFANAIAQALPPLNRDGVARLSLVDLTAGAAVVRLALNDAASEDDLKAGAARDVLTVARIARGVPNLRSVQVVGTYPLPDAAGRRAERVAIDVTYSAAAARRLDLETTEPKPVFDAADQGRKVHPYFLPARPAVPVPSPT